MNGDLKQATVLEKLLLSFPFLCQTHAPNSPVYDFLKLAARQEIETFFPLGHENPVSFGQFGELLFPYHQMGAVDTRNLFDLDELIIFSFYWINRKKYRKVLDIGANLGLHSIILSRCGYEVSCYEPDPEHFKILQQNLENNHCRQVRAFEFAVSSQDGVAEFIRVLGNTTGSHLAGAKANPYGELERFPVKVLAIEPIIRDVDLMKLDVEGHEGVVLLATRASDWLQMDALVEVGNEGNARDIYNHFKSLGINLFAQKINWKLVTKIEEMPTSYHDGSLFISSKSEMPWNIL